MIDNLVRKFNRFNSLLRLLFAANSQHGLINAYYVFLGWMALRKQLWPRYKKFISLQICRCISRRIEIKYPESSNDEQKLEILTQLLLSKKNGIRRVLHQTTFSELGTLFDFYRHFGNFEIALLLRQLMLEQCVDLNILSLPYKQIVNAALEMGDGRRALSVLSDARISNVDFTYYKNARAMALALIGDLDSADAIWKSFYQKEDFAFREIIQGKTIAIVGPATPNTILGDEIDSYDFVIRTNYRVGSNLPTEHYGSRTNIAYYNHHRIANFLSEVITASENLNWVICKSHIDVVKYKLHRVSQNTKVRNAFLANEIFFFNSDPMAIQNILYDIIRFSPSKIKIFCTNFYNSKENYSNNYRAKPLQISEISKSLRGHEPFACYAFMKNLYDAGLFEADILTGTVISDGILQYARSMENLYGIYGSD